MPATLYQAESLPVYVPPPPGNDGTGTHWHTDAFVPRLPARMRPESLLPIMQAIDPAAFLQPNEIIPGLGPDSTGQNHFSRMFAPRLEGRGRYQDPIENQLDPDSWQLGNISIAPPDAMGEPVACPCSRQRSPPATPLGIPEAQSFPLTVPAHVTVRQPARQQPAGESVLRAVPSLPAQPADALSFAPPRLPGRPQPLAEQETGDVSSALAQPDQFGLPVRNNPRLVDGTLERAVFAPQLFADEQMLGWWHDSPLPVRPAPARQAGEQQAELAPPVNFVSPPLATPPGGKPALNSGRETLVTDPGSSTPDSQLVDGILWPPSRTPVFRPASIEQQPGFVDLGPRAILPALAAPQFRRPSAPISGETLVQSVVAPLPPVIGGCDLYAAVPARLPQRSQPGEQLGGPYDPSMLGATAPAGFVSAPLERPVLPPPPRQAGEQAGGPYDPTLSGPSAPNGFLSAPLSQPYPPVALRPRGGEAFLYVPPSVPVAVIVGCELYSAVPVVPPRRAPLNVEQPVVAQAQVLDWTPAPGMPSATRPAPTREATHLADAPDAGNGSLVPLSQPQFTPRRPTSGGESLVYAPVPPIVQVVVGCELFATVPARALPARQQPGLDQPNISQSAVLDWTVEPAQPIQNPKSKIPIQNPSVSPLYTEIAALPSPLSLPVYSPHRAPITVADVPESPQVFQVLAGLDGMTGGVIAARMRPQAAGVLLIAQQNFSVPDVSGYQAAWAAPPRSAPRPVWMPLAILSTTVFYGATGNPPAFVGSGQVLVAATDLWVFSPRAASIEVSQRGNRL